MSGDLHWKSAAELVADYQSGAVSPVEVTRAMLDRIGTVDPLLGSYDEVTAERAMAQAARAEAAWRSGEAGPLAGVPVAVKALCDMKGVRTAAGTKVMRGRIADTDATVVQRLEDAGAVILGLLVMTEGASAVHHPETPQPKNPWNTDHWSGASSSGSGVAVAAGLCFGALGSDTAGSIRAPSHFNGVTGLKPTYGRVSRAGVFPLSATLDHVGPMTRSAADAAEMLRIIAGPDEADPTAAQRLAVRDLAGLDEGIEGLRIGVDERWITEGVDPELAEAVLEAAAELERAGAVRVKVEAPDRGEAIRAGAAILHADVAFAHRDLFPGREHDYGPHLAELIRIGQRLTGIELAEAHEGRRNWTGRLAALHEDVDLLILPPTPAPAPPARLTHALSGDFFDQGDVFRFTLPFTLTGQPALTLPCGFSRLGLPLAFQLIGRPFEEETALRAGMAWQARTQWHLRHPDEAAWRNGGT